MYRRYFSNPVRYFIVYLFLPIVFFISAALVDVFYSALTEILPDTVPEYSQVLEKEEYARFMKITNGVSVLLAVFFISFLTGVYDNSRYEDVITKTDGLYKIREVFFEYFKRNFPSDVIATAIPALPFIALTLPSYSKKFLDYFGGYLAPHFRLTELFGTVGAYFAILSVSLIGRALAMPAALARYRSLWLTSFVDS